MALGQNMAAPDTVDDFLGPEPELPGQAPAPDPQPEPESPAPEPEPEPEQEATAEQAEPRQKFPSWTELKAARRERDQLAARLAAMEDEIRRRDNPPPDFDPNPPPDKDEDPIAYLEWENQQHAQRIEAMQQNQQVSELRNTIRYQEQSFSQRQPDYYSALEFLRQREEARARIMVGDNQQMIDALVGAREQVLINLAVQNGAPVPVLAYELAKAEGWKGPQPNANDDPSVLRIGGRAAQQAREMRQQLQSSSIGRAPGGPTRAKLISREQLLGLSEQDMDRLDREAPGWQDYIE